MGSHIPSPGVDIMYTAFSCVQIMVWPLMIGIYNVHTAVMAFSCTWRLYKHRKRVCTESWIWKKISCTGESNLLQLSTRPNAYLTSWVTSPPHRHIHFQNFAPHKMHTSEFKQEVRWHPPHKWKALSKGHHKNVLIEGKGLSTSTVKLVSIIQTDPISLSFSYVCSLTVCCLFTSFT